MKTSSYLIYTLVTLLSFSIYAQNRTGNIVEYFGKEKVEEVREGKVIHVFKEGLVLGQDRFFLNSNTTPKEPVFDMYLGNSNYNIQEGLIGNTDNEGESLKWEFIQVDSTNEFSDRRLRSGYLYLQYTSDAEKLVILDASGHTKILINGFPHEGDHYDFGYSLIPVKLKKGKNEFLMDGGRFPRMRARLLEAESPVLLTTRDLTTPDILREDNVELMGGIRIINTTESIFQGGKIVATFGDLTSEIDVPSVSPLNSRKVAFKIPPIKSDSNKVALTLSLIDKKGMIISEEDIMIGVRSKYQHHKNTFVSSVDGSIQYYSVAPSLSKDEDNQAMFLSVHGAGVEAVNQANAYKQKDWGHLVAATNRRPYGFAWEDWGRIDALEVLQDAERIYKTNKKRTYLTGHSMGGHGTWYLGATYPDRFAAIAPAAGYPDLLGYRDSFRRRLRNMTDQELKSMGFTPERVEEMLTEYNYTEPIDLTMDSMITRAGNPSRTLELKRNYLHFGVYVLHGEDDTVVPTFIAREMRSILGDFHNDFCYYEYPHGTHWYGDHSVDWPRIFDFFDYHTIKEDTTVSEIEFYTGSPGVSSKSNFIQILQQDHAFEISSFHFSKEDTFYIQTENTKSLKIDLAAIGKRPDTLWVDGQLIKLPSQEILTLRKDGETWKVSTTISLKEKGPHRYGGFKDAFTNGFVLVYATNGSDLENEWYYSRARFDAEKFYYRANGNVEIIADKVFDPKKYPDRNVILYGNASNNGAWKKLLGKAPFQVQNGKLTLGKKVLNGDQYGGYFIYPSTGSNIASVGVVTATGEKGMYSAFNNEYLVNGTTFPDVLIFNNDVLKEGIPGVECSGFFGMDWGVDSGDFVWRE
ncbi:MAG: alpha/beta hydrolase-fold protein [Bacteroidota bacterium]